MAAIVTTDSVITIGPTFSSKLVAIVSNTARTSNGTVPIQYLVQRRSRACNGLDFRSQSAGPSRLSAGNTNRAAMAESTNPARPRLRNAMTWAK